MELSADQARALDMIRSWQKKAPVVRYCTEAACSPDGGSTDEDGVKSGLPHTHGGAMDYPVFSLAGLAGSGKTALAGQLGGLLGLSIAYATPTNKAAGVLRRKLDLASARKVRTYFSMMYTPVAKYKCTKSGRQVMEIGCGCALKRAGEDNCDCPRRYRPCGRCGGSCKVDADLQFMLRETVGGHRDLVLLDEASMISEARVNEIRSLGVPVLLVGDHGQLPPVKERMNRWMLAPDFTLVTNHRQADANGIVAAALRMRENGVIEHGAYGDGSTFAGSAKQNPAVLEIMNPERLKPGPDAVIIAPVNTMRASINRKMHEMMPASERDRQRNAARQVENLPSLPHLGERVISLQNHYNGITAVQRNTVLGWNPTHEEFVWNGATGTVRDVNPRGEKSDWTVTLVIELDDTPVLGGGDGNVHVLVKADVRQFGAPAKMRPDQHVKDAQLWDYAYCLTAHKAQGSEYSRVVVLDANPAERKRWMYTAMTRAKDKLVVIDWR